MVTIIPTEGATDRPNNVVVPTPGYADVEATTLYKFVFSLDLNRQVV